jgi:uncharacterized protein
VLACSGSRFESTIDAFWAKNSHIKNRKLEIDCEMVSNKFGLTDGVVNARLASQCIRLLMLLGLVAALIGARDTYAQATVAPSHIKTTAIATPKGALFKASKDGKIIHLFGTMHVGSVSSLPLGHQAMTSLAASQTLLLELDLSDPNVPRQFEKYAMAPKAIKLTATQREVAINAAKIMGIPADKMLKFRPMMLAAMVTIAQGHASGLKADYGSDLFLFSSALSAKIPVIGMESVQEQLKMDEDLSESEADQMVQDAFRDIANKRVVQMLKEMSAAWIRGDLEEIARISEITKNEYNKKILAASNKRNYGMVEKIVAASNAATRPVFAAAGALHFWGEESIPSLLKKRGYRIERIH